VTILEHVHSRQFCVTDAHLSERAYAIQIGGSRATAATSDHHAARLEIINCGVRDLARSSPRPLGPSLFEQVKDRAPWGLHVCLVKTGDRMSWSRPVSVHERGTRA
jgi:hypothetical protein